MLRKLTLALATTAALGAAALTPTTANATWWYGHGWHDGWHGGYKPYYSGWNHGYYPYGYYPYKRFYGPRYFYGGHYGWHHGWHQGWHHD